MGGHTILLLQTTKKQNTRTFKDYSCLDHCLNDICKIYEEHLKRLNPNHATITYDPSQLFEFLDQLWDVNCLVYQESERMYAPYNREYIKEKIYIILLESVMVKHDSKK